MTSLSCFDVRVTADSHRVEADLASLDIDEAVHAPGLTPLILADPKEAAVALVVAPPDHFDRMAAHHLTRYVLIRPILIRCEVLVD